MIFDSELNSKFEELYNKLKLKGDLETKELKDIILIITDQKRLMHQYDLALEKINRLKSLLQRQNKPMPLILRYREAAIYFEYSDKRELEKAEKLFLELVDEKKLEPNIKDRCHFFLCKIYLEKAKMEEDDESIKINLEKAGKYLEILNGNARIDKLDDSVLSWLWEVKEQINNFNISKAYVLFAYPELQKIYFKTIDEAKSHLENIGIVLNFADDSVIINGEIQGFFENDMKVLALLSKGSKIEEFKLDNDLEPNNTTQQRISRMKKELKLFFPDKAKTIVTKTNKDSYKLSPSIKVAILLNREKDNFIDIDELLNLGFRSY